MAVAALVVSIIAIVVAATSAVSAWRSARSAVAADLRAREPELVLAMDPNMGERDNAVLYTIRNDGPQDLHSVVVHRPQTDDGVEYPVAPVGGSYGPHFAEVGPLPMAELTAFMLAVGVGSDLPDFCVRIVCKADRRDKWTLVRKLDSPRAPMIY